MAKQVFAISHYFDRRLESPAYCQILMLIHRGMTDRFKIQDSNIIYSVNIQ